MIETLKNSFRAGLLTGPFDEIRPEAGPADRLDHQAGQWVRRAVQSAAASWCLKFHRSHYRRYGEADGRIKVRCACCGRKFIRIQQWKQFGHRVF
jgi:hypothetical protein